MPGGPPYAAIVQKAGSTYYAYRGDGGALLNSGTNFGTVINSAFTSVNGLGGGMVFLRQGLYTATAATPIVPTAGVKLVGEGAAGQPPNTTTLYTGSVIKGPAGSMGGPLINGTDVPGFVMENVGVDANSQCTYCVVFSGARSGASNCSFVKGTTAAVRFTDGASSTAQAYVDMFFGPNNWVHQGGTATKGVVVETSGAGSSRPTDGAIFGNNRIWGARSGGISVTAGGWGVTDNRVVCDTSATLGAYFSSSHGRFSGNTLDSIGGTAHFLEIDGSSTEVTGNRFLLSSSGTSGAIIYVTSGNSLIIANNFIDGSAGQAYTYGLDFASDPTIGTTNINVDGLWSRLTAAGTALSHYATAGGGYTISHFGHHT